MIEKNKKLLFSAYSLDLGGIETALISLLNCLAEKNYDITLVLEKKQGIFLNEINENIKIIEYAPSYQKDKIIAKTLNALKRIKFYIKYKNKFDFACSYATYCKMGSVVARMASKNNALWVHNNYYSFFESDEDKYKEFFNSIHSHEFKNILFVSDEAKQQYIEKYGIETENVLTCNNLINYKKILELSELNIELKKDENVTTFVSIARHDEHQKKISRLLECARMLNQDGEKFRILLVGDGEDTKKYKEMVNKYELNERVNFIGKTKNPYPFIKVADCVILTSDYEGYPVTYLESMVLNKPIITTDVSDSKTEIDGRYGVVVDKKVQSIYMAMKDFIKNKFIITEKFNPELYNSDIISKVEKIINERVI